MKQTPILLKTFVSDAAVPRPNLVLVKSGAVAGNVAAPGAAGATGFIGISQGQSSPTKLVNLMVVGIAQVESDGSAVINAGDYLTVGNVTGQVKSSAAPAFGGATTQQIIGIALTSAVATAGLLVDVLIQPMLHRP